MYLVKLPHHFENNGDHIVMEGLVNDPFDIARVLVVRAPKDAIRGQHCHKACTQFLSCPRGIFEVKCTDGTVIQGANSRTKDGTLTVLCDQVYKSEDYIRDYEEFLTY